MKYLKVFLFFVLCFFNVSETIRYDETDNLSLIVNYLINTNENWMSVIIPRRKILINHEFQTIEMYLTKLPKQLKSSTSSSQKKYFVSKPDVLQTLNFMYTALKCEYAYLIRDILKFLYHEPKKTFKSLKGIQIYLGKVIFNLFKFKELSSDLKSSDQTLTISLLSINVFLYKNGINPKKYAKTLLTKWIHQMISLIEIFICKMCFFEFAKLDIMSTQSQNLNSHYLDECLSRLKNLSDIGLYDDKYIDPDMYNPYNFLMHDYTNDIGLYDLMIECPSVPKKTMHIFESLITSYGIKNVLIYQIFLIESLRSLFSQQIMDVLQNITYDSNEKLSKLDKLSDGFNKYMDLIPDNYPPEFLNFIHDIKNALTDSLQSDKDNFESLHHILNNILSTTSIIHLETKKINSMTIISITDLIKNIKVSPYFSSFKQTFEILLQEPNMLKDYYLLDEINYDKITKSSNETSDVCLLVPQIRIGFIWIWVMLDRMPDDELKKSLDSYILTIFKNVTYLYEFKNTKSMVKKSLLNLLNHVKNSTSQSLANINSIEFVILKQLILSTVITMDYQELNNCEVTEENKTLYAELTCLHKFPFTYIQEEIDLAIQRICKMTGHRYDGTSEVQKGHTYIDTIKSLDEKESNKTHFYWYVYKKQVLNICQDLYQDFKTPDNHQINYRFQLTVLEWYLYKAYTQVLCMFRIKNKLPSNEQIVFIKEVFEKLLESLTFSTYLIRVVLHFINIYVNYFENKTIDEESIKNFTDIANEHADKLPYPHISIKKFQQIHHFYYSFNSTIEFIYHYFIDTNNVKFIVDENNLTVSMFWDKLNMKC